MVFNAALPADSTKLRDLGVVIRPNWTAINTADETFAPDAINFGEQGADLAKFDDIYRLYSKADAVSTFTELFGINSNGDVSQLTRGATTAAASGSTFLPGGLRMQWGILNNMTTSPSSTISPSLTTLYNISFAVQGNVANTFAWEYNAAPNFRFIRSAGVTSTNIMWVVIGV